MSKPQFTAQSHSCKVVSVGAWGSYFSNTDELTQLLDSAPQDDEGTEANYSVGPKPQAIPANERRRAPLLVRLAVEASWQATEKAGISPQDLKCVFVSGLGDTSLTDYMCSVLASETKELSPTKFHNSVHNAPAGYWTISTEAMGAANSVAGFEGSVSITLLDAIIQCNYENTPILVAFYDAPVAEPFKTLLKNQQAFAAAIIIYPENSDKKGAILTTEVINKITAPSSTSAEKNSLTVWPALASSNKYLREIYDDNPAGKVLCILERLLSKSKKPEPFTLPVSEGVSLLCNIQ